MDLLGSGVLAASSLMYGDQAVAARRRMDERRPEPRLQLVEPPAQRQQRRVHGRVRGVVAEQPGLDEVAGRGGLGPLGKEEDERRLLLGKARVALTELHRASRRVELQPAEPVGAGPARASLDEAGGEIG